MQLVPHPKHTKAILCAFSLTGLAFQAGAALTINLPGTTESAVWTGLSNANHSPTSNTTDPWGPVAADGGSSVTLSKLSGPAYFYSQGIYGWHTAGSTYAVQDLSPMAGLETVVLQMRLGFDPVSVTLSWNGGSQSLVATDHYASIYDTTSFGGNPSYIKDNAWQWDLSFIVDPITDYTINFELPSSTIIYANNPMRLDAGDTYAGAIPEPATYAILLGLLALGLTTYYRRHAKLSHQ